MRINIIVILLSLILATPVFASTYLSSEPPGTIITFSGKQWIVLDHIADGSTYIILDLNDGSRAFDPDDTQLFNPLDTNNIAWYLNSNFYNGLTQKDLIKSYSWEIKYPDGTGPQPNINAKICLLSYGEYTTYKNLLPGGTFGWLRTPHSGHTAFVWLVDANGSFGFSGAAYALVGVRPVLYLEPGIWLNATKEVMGIGEPVPPPGAPSGLSVSSITQTSATASWSAVSGATEYKIYLNGSLIATTASTTGTLNGLNAGTTYQVQVSAVGPGGEGVKAITTFTTLAPPPPGAPSGLSISSITQTSATASWSPVTGATEYKVYLNGAPIATTTSTNRNLTGLSADTTYQVQVSAVGPGGEGAKASTNFTTSAPPPPLPQEPGSPGMSFDLDMQEVLQQFTNVFGSLAPIIWLFIGGLLALFVLGGVLNVIANKVRN